MNTVDLMVGENIFAIMAHGSSVLRRAKLRHLEAKMMEEVQKSSYSEAIKVVKKYVAIAENKSTQSVELPAGKYILADPCTVLSDSEYDELLEKQLTESGWDSSKFCTLSSGKNVWVINTKHGDGRFTSNLHHSIPVDSGGIAVITAPSESVHEHMKNEIMMTHPFSCFSDEGVLHFGHVTVDTDEKDECEYCGLSEYECECDNSFTDDDDE
ncbi:MAG: hypothetical protein ACK5XN_31020 [Bacteroidota bacterium]|jgi:hypothetical protein